MVSAIWEQKLVVQITFGEITSRKQLFAGNLYPEYREVYLLGTIGKQHFQSPPPHGNISVKIYNFAAVPHSSLPRMLPIPLLFNYTQGLSMRHLMHYVRSTAPVCLPSAEAQCRPWQPGEGL